MTINEYIQALEDACDNFLGMLDNPVARSRRNPGGFEEEAVNFAKKLKGGGWERPEIKLSDVELSVKQYNALHKAGVLE